VVLDYLLPDANGVDLACHLRSTHPELAVMIATGAELTSEDQATCSSKGFPILRKPFLADELMNVVRSCLTSGGALNQDVRFAAAQAARMRTAP